MLSKSATIRLGVRAGAACATAAALIVAPTVSLPSFAAFPDAGNKPAQTQTQTVALGKGRHTDAATAQSGQRTTVETGSTNPPPGAPAAGSSDSDTVVDVPVTGDMLAVTWNAAAWPSADVLMRTKTSAGWSDWSRLEPQDGAAGSDGKKVTKIGSEPVWAPGTTEVQVRTNAATAASLGNAQVAAITPSATPTPGTSGSTPAAAAKAAGIQPPIITRAQWGADESLRGGCVPEIADTTKGMVVHHTADTNNYSAAQSAALVRSIYAYHTQSLGWCDIGYNVLIDQYGQIFEGRFGGLKNSVVGAHAVGFNWETFGVSLIGNYDTAPLSSATFDSLTSVLAMRAHDFYFDPTGQTTYTVGSTTGYPGAKFPVGSRVTLPTITGHRDTYQTACPGQNVYNQLPQIRAAVAAKTNYQDSQAYQRWRSMGGASSSLGPVSQGELFNPTLQRTQTAFQGGWTIFARWAGGTALVGPGITATYLASGSPSWGDPSDERAVPGGSEVDFSNGVSLVWTAATNTVMIRAGFLTYWQQRGGTASRLGAPAGPEHAVPGGSAQGFVHGNAWYSDSTWVHATYAGFDATYNGRGGSTTYGFPTSDETPVLNGAQQSFERGSFYYGPTSGIHSVWLGMRVAYLGAGGPTGALGFPTGNETANASGTDVTQTFQHGMIDYPLDGRAPVITLR